MMVRFINSIGFAAGTAPEASCESLAMSVAGPFCNSVIARSLKGNELGSWWAEAAHMASRFFSKAMAAGSGLGGRLWPDVAGTRDSSPAAGVGAARLTGGWGPALCDRVRLRRRGLSATVMLQQEKDRGLALQRHLCRLARAKASSFRAKNAC